MSLIATARALDDQRFLWRVRAAALTVAVEKAKGAPGPERDYANAVLSSPMQPDLTLEAIAAVNAVISAAVVVDPASGVDTEAVQDSDILFVVTDAWGLVSTRLIATP